MSVKIEIPLKKSAKEKLLQEHLENILKSSSINNKK